MEEVGYLDQLTFGHPVKEGELYSLESSLVLSRDEDNHDDSGSDIGNSRPIDREYPIGH